MEQNVDKKIKFCKYRKYSYQHGKYDFMILENNKEMIENLQIKL